MKKAGTFAAGVLLFAACSTTKQMNKPFHFEANKTVAHRGAFKTKGLPENSIAALKEAIALRCEGSEFDVHLTADDSLVVNHDHSFFGMHIEKSTYQELLSKKHPNGEPIPTVRQYLLTGMQQRATRLILEIKPSSISKERGQKTAAAVAKMVKELKAQPWIVYISFDYDILKTLHRLQPDIPSQYLNGDKSPEQLKADGISGADYHFSVFQKHPEWIESAHANNIVLNAWTVNDAATMRWLLDKRFRYITTNEPELLLKEVAQTK
ncbi:MAG: glycerophosphodiester phosphodiesterase [Chitinophagaceae bacterium]